MIKALIYDTVLDVVYHCHIFLTSRHWLSQSETELRMDDCWIVNLISLFMVCFSFRQIYRKSWWSRTWKCKRPALLWVTERRILTIKNRTVLVRTSNQAGWTPCQPLIKDANFTLVLPMFALQKPSRTWFGSWNVKTTHVISVVIWESRRLCRTIWFQ